MHQDLYDKTKKTVKKMCVWNFMTHLDPTPGNLCIRHKPCSWDITGKGWHELQSWRSVRQHNTAPYCICHQKPIGCWVALQQYRMCGLGNTTQARQNHHYCFAMEVCNITDQKLLVAIPSKDVAALFQQLKHIMLHTHQYRVCIIYRPGPHLYITDWLSRNNHTEDKD